MKQQAIEDIRAFLEGHPEPQLLFEKNTLAAINACARGLLPSCQLGDPAEKIFGGDVLAFESASNRDTVLFSAEIGGTPMGVQLTPFQRKYRLARLIPTQNAAYAQAMRAIAESLGTPLTSIQVAKAKLFPKLEELETLEEPGNAQILAWAAQMNRGLYSILRIVGNLRLLGDPKALTNTIKMRTNITLWLENLHQHLEPLMREARRNLTVELPQHALYCDINEDLLRQAILNVISNSVKYTEPEGHIVFRAETREPNRLMITIQDDGCGMSGWGAQSIDQLFLLRPQILDGRSGTGLGLYMAKQILEDHGGRLFVAFHPKTGTTVYLQLSTVPRPRNDLLVRSESQLPDRCGGYDPYLRELADVLPDAVFDPRDVN